MFICFVKTSYKYLMNSSYISGETTNRRNLWQQLNENDNVKLRAGICESNEQTTMYKRQRNQWRFGSDHTCSSATVSDLILVVLIGPEFRLVLIQRHYDVLSSPASYWVRQLQSLQWQHLFRNHSFWLVDSFLGVYYEYFMILLFLLFYFESCLNKILRNRKVNRIE